MTNTYADCFVLYLRCLIYIKIMSINYFLFNGCVPQKSLKCSVIRKTLRTTTGLFFINAQLLFEINGHDDNTYVI